MKRFRFDLESVRRVRQETERRRAQALARARTDLTEARAARTELERAEQEIRVRISEMRAGGTSVGQLQNLEFVLSRLQGRITEAAEREREAARTLERTIEEFQEAAREREILDRLRERRLGDWRAEQNRTEQKALDEVGLRGHGDDAEGLGRRS